MPTPGERPAVEITSDLLLRSAEIGEIIDRALAEDIGTGDVTAEAVLPETIPARGAFLAKQEMLVCGMPVLERLYRQVDHLISFHPRVRDGARVGPSLLAVVEGDAHALLRTERVALNFLQRLTGIATFTDRFSEELQGTKAKLRDTRKTTPGLRLLEKYAVRIGGGTNHRMGLYDAVLIKENHVRLAGGVAEAVRRARGKYGQRYFLQIEVRNEEELQEALDADPDAVLLDNMAPEEVRRSVERVGGRLEVEASGGIRLENGRAYAEAGVDFISVGALTHSAPAVDISFDLVVKETAGLPQPGTPTQ